MHRQAFFSLLVVVVTLCAALSIAAPTKASSPSLSKIPTKPNTPAPALPAPKEPSKPAKSPKTSPQSSKRPSSTAETNGKTSSKKAREAGDPGLESRSPNPVTTVCDVPIRDNVDCTGRPSPLENVKRRTNSPGSEYVPGSSSPEHSSEGEGANVLECEHAVELQLLGFTFKKNGFCDALDALVSHSGGDKATYLADIKTEINQKTNLYNIPHDTNAAKNQITAKFKAGNGKANAPTIPFDVENVIQWGRVKTYLSTSYVSSNAEKLVKSIDEMATKLLNKAASDAKKCATQQQIDAAKAEYISSRGTMEMIWENYIKFVTNQADVKQNNTPRLQKNLLVRFANG
ncbi:hypothetical protein DFJ43DRAFT_1149872 [Lentinula guzmanii]|uniref:Uncharacterized protein n=1 Tax=Lentinula guzmanii TaxID=2804957 RepID=A0AA38JT50_9AGAR|nr:hypothetical protein DFJ43DRAFT_1149872 [Lentinula guzmanii]